MPEIEDFSGPAYRLDPNTSPSRQINLYSELVERGPRAGKVRMRKIPGLADFCVLPTAPVRGLWSSTAIEFPIGNLTQQCFAVGGDTLYQIDANGHTTNIGKIANGPNPVRMVASGFQLALASNGQGFIAPGGGVGVFPIVDTAGTPIEASSIAFLDQYFIAAIVNTKQIRISNLAPDGGIWDASDAAIKEAYADNIRAIWVDQPGGEYLFVFGTETMEVWGNTGGLFPFSRLPQQVESIGLDSTWSIAGVAGFRAWLWRGVIYGCEDFNPKRISDYGVEQAISTYSLDDQQQAEAFAWVDRGHIFYAITFPISGKTWVYDRSLGMWHERAFFQNGRYTRYRPRVYTRFLNMDLVGDYATGKIYKMDQTVYTDAGGFPLRWERICPYTSDAMKNDRYNRLTIDMDTGVGLSVASNQPGYDPQVMMRYSNNRGKNWSNERQATVGQIGENSTRVFWPQLGSSRIGMTFDVYGTDPVPVSINTAYLDIGLGHSPGNRPTS